MTKVAVLLAAALALIGCSQPTTAWPPETTSALYQVAYASAKRNAMEHSETPRRAFVDAKVPLDMLETMLHAAVHPGESDPCPGSDDSMPLTHREIWGGKDSLRLAEIALAYSAATMVDNRHNAFRVPGIVESALELLGLKDKCAGASAPTTSDTSPETQTIANGLCRLKWMTGKNIRRGEVLAIPAKMKEQFVEMVGLDGIIDHEKISDHSLTIVKAAIADEDADYYYLAPEHLIDPISYALRKDEDNDLEARRETLIRGLKSAPPNIRLIEYYAEQNEEDVGKPEFGPKGHPDRIDPNTWKKYVKAGDKTFSGDAPALLVRFGSHDLDDLSILFRKEVRRRERALLQCNQDASPQPGDLKNFAPERMDWIDRHLDDLPDHRSFHKVVANLRDSVRVKGKSANSDGYTSAILVATENDLGSLDNICVLNKALKKYNINSIIFVPPGKIKRCEGESVTVIEATPSQMKEAISKATGKQLLVAWSGHGANGKLDFGTEAVAYDDLHKAIAENKEAIRSLVLVDACHSGSAAYSGTLPLKPRLIAGITAEADRYRLVYVGSNFGMISDISTYLNDWAAEQVEFDHLELYDALREKHRSRLESFAKGRSQSDDTAIIGTAPGLYTLRSANQSFNTQRFLFRPVAEEKLR